VRKLLVLVVSALTVAVALAASGSAFAAGGDGPRRDGGRGVWFTRVCAIPGAALGACGAQVVTSSGGTPLAGTSPAPTALGPAQFHSAYGLPTTAPTTQTIAIVDAYDNPKIESDLATFSSFYGLPPCTTANGCFRKVNQAGGRSYPAPNANWSLEIALDVETAHAICQNCKILLVEASSASLANLGAAENLAVTMGANVVSNSWGASEYFAETLDEAQYFDHPGVVITASTGDNGYEVQFPAASQYVTAVGGTTLHLNSNGSWGSETAWNGTGSGCSVYITKPSWQTDVGCSGRTVADISADADPNTGAAVYNSVSYLGQSGWFQVGGTSLSAPLIASVYALTGTASSANYGSAPYARTSLLHDVTSGSNGSCSPAYLCTAGVGFDGPTGLGTPNGLGAFTTGAPPPPPTPDFTVGASPATATVTQGTNASYTVSVGATGGFTGTVNLSQTGLPNGTFTPTSVTGSGSSTLSVSTASIAPGSYPFTITATSGSLTHSVSATLVVQSAPPPPTPDFTVGASPATATVTQGTNASYTVSVGATGGFTGTVNLSQSGLPNGTFTPASVTTSGSSTLSVSTASIAPGSYPFTITGTSGSLTHSVSATLVVQSVPTGPPPDFAISVSSSSRTVIPPATSTFTVSITPSNGFSAPVTLSASGFPAGMSGSFATNPITSSTTFTITSTNSIPFFTRATIKITGTSGSLSHSTTISILVL
jgi:subtilase family serine protease